jgi:hypothetical protein
MGFYRELAKIHVEHQHNPLYKKEIKKLNLKLKLKLKLKEKKKRKILEKEEKEEKKRKILLTKEKKNLECELKQNNPFFNVSVKEEVNILSTDRSKRHDKKPAREKIFELLIDCSPKKEKENKLYGGNPVGYNDELYSENLGIDEDKEEKDPLFVPLQVKKKMKANLSVSI